jgi:hypothetical protein
MSHIFHIISFPWYIMYAVARQYGNGAKNGDAMKPYTVAGTHIHAYMWAAAKWPDIHNKYM